MATFGHIGRKKINMFYSPLRYPGGKNRLAKLIGMICETNNIRGHYVEPYAGGASVALYLLIGKKVAQITINDYDRSIYAFWYAVLNHTEEFCRYIEHTDVNIKNWRKARDIQKNKAHEDLLTLGLSTFFLNRTNVSGILKGGVIGGLKQQGRYKIDCRFNKKELIQRILQIAQNKAHINLYHLDALVLIDKIKEMSNNPQTIFYFDPPYYAKGASLYMNYYTDKQHAEMAQAINRIQRVHWIVSYDDTPEIERMYKAVPETRKKKYTLNHAAYQAKQGKEILFFSENLNLPSWQDQKMASIMFTS